MHDQDRCQGPQSGCAQLPTLEITLGRLSDRSLLAPLRVCSQCGACLLTVHGVWPEGAPSPFRVVLMRLLQQPVSGPRRGRYPARPSRPAPAPEGAVSA
ncbi:hypothetical protein [Actinomadura decatromicini]|uniref:Uncharacterized protein n=1 Tax=Actinomadura decatromicini TaxID=2604572 RepID=A0A5D3FK56_9ACTN|nr:hypothetical protein [Actinomadura decatromicini]TYK48070.1 hypothetical protein FXF68_20550 [Actinomadura decatromicini]